MDWRTHKQSTSEQRVMAKAKAAPRAKKVEVDTALAILAGAMPVNSSDDQERFLLSKGQLEAIREALGDSE